MWQLYGELARAVEDGRIVDALNHDEALLTILYSAGGNPVLLDMIRSLWQRCRPYKILGARRALESSDGTLWTFQPRIVEAARDHDGRAVSRHHPRLAVQRQGPDRGDARRPGRARRWPLDQ